MPTRRQIQVADQIQQIISVLIQRDLKDPRLGFVTVTQVDVSQDLKYARVFVSVMGTPEEQKSTMDALASGRGYIRRELASRLEIRAVPELQFRLDRGVEYSDRINRLLNEIKQADEANEEAQAASGDASPEGDVPTQVGDNTQPTTENPQ
ncbi:MAG: 30S ribosome-binding factor RbfA [Chloroflexota bacterium]